MSNPKLEQAKETLRKYLGPGVEEDEHGYAILTVLDALAEATKRIQELEDEKADHKCNPVNW